MSAARAVFVARRALASKPLTAQRSYRVASPAMAKILATDGVDQCCIDIFKERGHVVDFKKTMPEDELAKIIGEYDGLVVRSATKVTPAIIKNMKKMRIIGRAGVGIDNINVPESTKAGIMVMNTPGGNTTSTAQLAISLLCALARNIPAADLSVKEGKWDRKSFTGIEMHGKTLGVVGCGRIGQEVANMAREIGMNVIGYDPVMSAESFKAVGLAKVELDQIWKHSDFITVHTPLTPETSNLLDETSMGLCKRGVRIVNCARGGIVDEAALLKMLESGQVGGAALDVFTSEPPKEHLRPLIMHPHLVCTPHLGASTEEAQINVARDIATQMCDVFDQKDYFGVTNVSYLMASTQVHMKPFMKLAETIGAMQAQIAGSPVKKVTLKTFGGRDANITTKQARQLLEAKVLKGLVKHMGLGLVPDLISAPAMAVEADVQSMISEEAPSLSAPYWNLLSVEAERADGTATRISGAVFGNAPHIIEVDQYSDSFAFKPEGNYLLTFKNADRPGAISEVLEILQRFDVNIASLQVARAKTGTSETADLPMALCFMALDDDVSTNAMAALLSLGFLSDVAKIKLQ
ncbi:D-isomer specific 2-hydroxyacid dehydrogenase [Ochromonadaceae sp. CCMP2298]|nr:D-isomer specific 2-hydroxyacid dehydrogenase [Ochromonadaceae sp. CCMP2298]|mmetsp:Transcript_30118/g.66663  ORF Transcript_30118/g.66663 Transcript_30118/m.66663 type:complete len:579 (+) Transcript_30118:152-1888(+)